MDDQRREHQDPSIEHAAVIYRRASAGAGLGQLIAYLLHTSDAAGDERHHHLPGFMILRAILRLAIREPFTRTKKEQTEEAD